MTLPLRVEVCDEGVLVAAKTVPNLNVAKVFIAHQEQSGLRALLVCPRTETEDAA